MEKQGKKHRNSKTKPDIDHVRIGGYGILSMLLFTA